MTTGKVKKMSLGLSLLSLIFLVVFLVCTLKFWGGDPHIALIAGAVFASFMGLIGGYTWKEIEEGIIDTIKLAMQACLILMIIGAIIGTWILAGIVPTMIFYGLKIITPSIFLVAACLLCAIVSLATGSSWTTAGTIGIALIGVGTGLGIPLGMTAGAIVSGAYFGDKMSPLSDTTNLAPAMAGTDLFTHIRHMLWTTGPALLISLVIYAILGFGFAGKQIDTVQVNEILTGLDAVFNINPLLFIPPILVILIVVMRVPAIPGLIGGVVLGGLFAWIFQGAGMTEIIGAAHYGFELNTEVLSGVVSQTVIDSLNDLLTRGGLDSMLWTVSLIICAMCFGGVMEKTKQLETIAMSIMRFAKKTGSIVLTTVITCIATNLLTGDQYLSIVLPGRMYKDIYVDKGLDPRNLSRTLEDAGTVTSPFIPWNTCGATMTKFLGVGPWGPDGFAIYAFLNILCPIIAVFYGYTGIGIKKLEKSPKEESVSV
ncbi:Na+/H+ antiporter NhaC [Oceanirhabdus sp. W0125-5]|uniref:Na+/H+ antiporter NhaC n=1 Tax=Oceanirhabdus sp. W0125-5 TaxID=2999116 RepID=UPI0022F33943|nr:Na+/H+ antiporter NhaC [Oceanirhabdus sp. W0125-5]WBW99600.1 Na+/H+ antiporter NhaC [Oceanirhabdus sp. W0125-5]